MAKRKKKGDKDKELPIWTLDCETDPFLFGRVPKPFIWGLYDGENTAYYQFDTAAQVVEFIRDKEILVYAHNGGRFDYHFMIEFIEVGEPIMIINGRLARWKIGKAEMRDSYNILPVPLSAYKKDDMDYHLLEAHLRDIPENRIKIEEYLKNDCVYLFEFVTQFIARFGRHLTMAGASMATWESMRGEPAPKTDAAYYEYFRPFYYGGRVQCFQRGVVKTKFRVADINSAYPRAMLDKHPIGTKFEIHSRIEDVKGALGPCFITVECVARGCFPFRFEDRLFFPADNARRTYHITGWEYLAAIETGTIENIRIIDVFEFVVCTDFADYINHFYAARQQAKKDGDAAMNIFSKLFMNSLYGKFASNPQEYDEYLPFDTIEECEAQKYEFAGLLGPYVLGSQKLPEYRQRFYNVATGASITGWVRAYLWRAICASTGVLYCDTDSIAAETMAVEYGDALGQWKDEGGFVEASIAGKKLYAFKMDDATKRAEKKKNPNCSGYKQASKGVNLTAARIKKVAAGKPQTATFDAPTFSLRKAPGFLQRTVTLNARDSSRLD